MEHDNMLYWNPLKDIITQLNIYVGKPGYQMHFELFSEIFNMDLFT